MHLLLSHAPQIIHLTACDLCASEKSCSSETMSNDASAAQDPTALPAARVNPSLLEDRCSRAMSSAAKLFIDSDMCRGMASTSCPILGVFFLLGVLLLSECRNLMLHGLGGC